jgi:hypothetical protein
MKMIDVAFDLAYGEAIDDSDIVQELGQRNKTRPPTEAA